MLEFSLDRVRGKLLADASPLQLEKGENPGQAAHHEAGYRREPAYPAASIGFRKLIAARWSGSTDAQPPAGRASGCLASGT